MLSVLAAFGTRPEAIKMAPLIRALRARPEISLTVVATGEQHTAVEKTLTLFDCHPDIELEPIPEGLSHAAKLALILETLSPVMTEHAPELVMVLGDTTTTLAATIAAYYQQIPVAHVEAGLRTESKYATFPQEGHRLMISGIADLYFAPTNTTKNHLLAEGVDADRIYVTGNPGIDALKWATTKVAAMRKEGSLKLPELFEAAIGHGPVAALRAIREVERGDRRLVLVTGSRPETLGSRLQSVCGALVRLADAYPDDVFVYPVSLNEEIRESVEGLLGDRANVFILPALEYLPFVYLMQVCHFVITDSGGIQEEAPALGKPVLVMRRNTDRPEALKAGSIRLVGTDAVTIFAAARRLFQDPAHYLRMANVKNPFGDGQASEYIANIIASRASFGIEDLLPDQPGST